MRKRLMLMTMAVILLAVTITGIVIGGSMKRLQTETAKARLTDVTSLLLVEAEQVPPDDLGDMAAVWAAQLNKQSASAAQDEADIPYRITIIAKDGTVLGDSDLSPALLSNHANRPEVQQAFATGYGSDIRKSSSEYTNYMYVAMTIPGRERLIRASFPMLELAKLNRVIYRSTALGIFLAILAAYFLSFSLSNRFLRPISRMRQAASMIAQGNYDQRINREPDEIGLLAEDFNRMTETLATTISREKEHLASISSILQSTSTGILAIDKQNRITQINPAFASFFDLPWKREMVGHPFTDFTRNSQLQQLTTATLASGENQETQFAGIRVLQLTTAPIVAEGQIKGVVVAAQDITRLRKLEDMRSEFVANVTHELKTPLTAIRGYVETLQSGMIQDPAVIKEMLEIIDIQSQRLQNLIADLLALSEIENGNIKINDTLCDVGEIIDTLFKDMQPAAAAREISLTVQKAGDLRLTASREHLYRMLANLIDNGIKYNRPGGTVAMKAEGHNGILTLTVADDGIGISQEHQKRIFERFYRVDTGRSREMGGTGLGLSIVKHLVQLYGGSVSVESNPQDGTRFTIRLPQ